MGPENSINFLELVFLQEDLKALEIFLKAMN